MGCNKVIDPKPGMTLQIPLIKHHLNLGWTLYGQKNTTNRVNRAMQQLLLRPLNFFDTTSRTHQASTQAHGTGESAKEFMKRIHAVFRNRHVGICKHQPQRVFEFLHAQCYLATHMLHRGPCLASRPVAPRVHPQWGRNPVKTRNASQVNAKCR